MSTKFKKLFILVPVLILSMLAIPMSAIAAPGDEGEPIEIANCTELQDMATGSMSAYYELTGDVTCTGEFTPIGTDGARFTGSLDGNNFSISGITVTGGSTDAKGLFGALGEGSNVVDLEITNANISGRYNIGILAGQGHETNIDNVTTSGIVSSTASAGGITGVIIESTLTDSSSDASVTGFNSNLGGALGAAYLSHIENVHTSGTVTNSDDEGYQTGGLIGNLDNSQISHSSSSGTVSGGGTIGGLVGVANSSSVSTSFATGDVLPTYVGTFGNAGGLVGYLGNTGVYTSYATGDVGSEVSGNAGGIAGVALGGSNIDDSYSKGNVTGTSVVGGILGISYTSGSAPVINRSYATGLVTSPGTKGAIVATTSSGLAANNSFWDEETTSITCESSCIGTPKSTPEMKSIVTFTDTMTEGLTNAWDFVNNPNDDSEDYDVWDIKELSNNGYPCLVGVGSSCINPDDVDDDGVDNEIEDAGPNDGDANDDGTLDSEQSNVASTTNPATDSYVAIESTTCDVSFSTVLEDDGDFFSVDEFDYPFGFVAFRLLCDVGATETVRIYFFDTQGENLVARKFDTITKEFWTIEPATISSDEFLGENLLILEYEITDGGNGDEDGQENGVIVDPAGIGTLAPTASTSPGGSSGSNNSTGSNGVSGSLPVTGAAGFGIASFALALIAGGFVLIRVRALRNKAEIK